MEYTIRSSELQGIYDSSMSIAAFDAIARDNRDRYAGSGYITTNISNAGDGDKVNDGIVTAKSVNISPAIGGTNVNRFAVLNAINNINGTLISSFIGNRIFTNSNFGLTHGYEAATTQNGQVVELPVAPTAVLDSTTTTSVHSIGEFIVDSSTDFVYICIADSTVGILLTNTAYFLSRNEVSRTDLIFTETWEEDITEKDFVYPYGNTQYLGTDIDGLTGIAAGTFTGASTYSLFGNWQSASALVGKGYVWSALNILQKVAFCSNPANKIKWDGNIPIQTRTRTRVVLGFGDEWNNYELGGFGTLQYSTAFKVNPKGKLTTISTDLAQSTYYFAGTDTYGQAQGAWQSSNTSVAYEGKCYALPVALVHRRNQGAYHPVFNANGSANHRNAYNDGSKPWYDGDAISENATSIASMFTKYSNSGVLQDASTSGNGAIGSTEIARPDGLFYDQIHEGDIIDLRMSAHEKSATEIIAEFNKAVTGKIRGEEGEKYTEAALQITTGTVATIEVGDGTKYKSGAVVQIYDLTASTVKGRFVVLSISGNTLTIDSTISKSANTYLISGASSKRKKSNTLLHCDIIGDPANYPALWQTGVAGTMLLVGEEGTSYIPDGTAKTYKLSKKALSTPLLSIYSTDNGVTWTAYTTTFSTVTNSFTNSYVTGTIAMHFYLARTTMANAAVNSVATDDVIDGVWAGNRNGGSYGAYLCNSLIGKVPVGSIGILTWRTKLDSIGYDDLNRKLVASGTYYSDTAHSTIALGTSNPAVKTMIYPTVVDGRYALNLIFKEMKYATTWGDDSKFNIVDNVSTTTDNNANVVLVGQKQIKLPYFRKVK